jgi:hypothetical protein
MGGSRPRRALVRDWGQKFVAVVLAGALFVAVISGITRDGLLEGAWAGTDDHPTNWLDTALHP